MGVSRPRGVGDRRPSGPGPSTLPGVRRRADSGGMTTNQPVLVAYDGSEDAERALVWAAHESVRTGSPLRVVTIDDVSTSPWGGEIWVRDPEMVAHAEAVLGDLGVEDGVVERRVGNVASTLLDLSESASLVVLGQQRARPGPRDVPRVGEPARGAPRGVSRGRRAPAEEARRGADRGRARRLRDERGGPGPRLPSGRGHGRGRGRRSTAGRCTRPRPTSSAARLAR